MASSSVTTMRTLKGIFDVPKMNHRRDFLRENKLNLRELQRITVNKQATQRQEREKEEQRSQQRHQRQQDHYVGRRSASQHRSSTVAEPVNDHKSQAHQLPRRANSQQRLSLNNAHQSRISKDPEQHSTHGSCACPQRALNVRRSASVASVASKAESCDKEIQTEDILDEEFLYEALKKCNSSEFNTRKARPNGAEVGADAFSEPNGPVGRRQWQPQYETNRLPGNESRQEEVLGGSTLQNFHQIETDSQYTTRSQCSVAHNGHATSKEVEGVERNFVDLNLESQDENIPETQSSGRSRQTLCSVRTLNKKRSNGSVHKLGSRDDVQLPRYLEREKREKEEERLREMSRDPKCPFGHYALTEDERLSALTMAQKKVDSLIQELNRMPMTTQTLRIRTRKAEIEKELVAIEADIRLFSKPKVYVTQPPAQY